MSADQGLQQRLDFNGIDETVCNRLKQMKPLLEKAMSGALDKFYQQVQAAPQTKHFFPTPAVIAHAKEKQAKHWSVIASAEFGAEYAANVKAIGQAHARLGIEPRWYIGGYALVLEQLIHAIVEARWPRLLSGGEKAAADVAGSLSALVKAALLDMDLAISIYLDTLEAQRQDEAAKRLKAQQEQAMALNALAAALDKLAGGDLTLTFDADVAPEFGKLKTDVNRTVARLAETVAGVAEACDSIDHTAGEIATAADDMAARTERQAASLEQSTAALGELTISVRRAADAAREAAATATRTRKDMEASQQVVEKAIAAMGTIEESSRQIGQIVGIIDEIAFQTNLLALNAGVEAARAGEAGRGFAVVASEVRGLAQRSAEAAKEIKTLISRSSAQVDVGVKLVHETGDALQATIVQMARIDALVAGIAEAGTEQASGLTEVDTAVTQMDKVTQQNAAMMEEATAATHSLHEEVTRLVGLVAYFKLDAVTTVKPAATRRHAAA